MKFSAGSPAVREGARAGLQRLTLAEITFLGLAATTTAVPADILGLAGHSGAI